MVNKFSALLAHLQQELAAKPCLLCMATTTNKHGICHSCIQDLPVNNCACQRCGLPLNNTKHEDEFICGECITDPPPFHKTVASFQYSYPIDSCIQQYKYRGRRYIAYTLSYFLEEDVQSNYRSESLPEALIPVPLHSKKKRQRGFNQSELIAKHLSKALNIPTIPSLLTKTKETDSQAQSNKKQRKRNLKKVFRVKQDFQYQHVALIDDVMTTRATAEVIAKLLLESGIEQVDIWCLARTPKPSQQ